MSGLWWDLNSKNKSWLSIYCLYNLVEWFLHRTKAICGIHQNVTNYLTCVTNCLIGSNFLKGFVLICVTTHCSTCSYQHLVASLHWILSQLIQFQIDNKLLHNIFSVYCLYWSYWIWCTRQPLTRPSNWTTRWKKFVVQLESLYFQANFHTLMNLSKNSPIVSYLVPIMRKHHMFYCFGERYGTR